MNREDRYGNTGPKPRPLVDRFWPMVQKTEGCWIWKGTKNPKGYGKIQAGSYRSPRMLYAHRVSFEIHFRPLLPGELVCHKCDTPNCVNPRHLFAGSHQENHDDGRRKGRVARGEDRAHSKLKKADVEDIRNQISSGATCAFISEQYQVSQALISRIKRGKAWRHITKSEDNDDDRD